MAEQSLTIRGYRCIKIRVEATRIRGEGGPEYPRLIIPAELDLSPIGPRGEEQHFAILNVQCGLFLQDPSLKIADAINNFSPNKVHFVGHSTTYEVEFPLDQYRIERIEEKRKDDLNITVSFHLITSLCMPQVIQRNDRQVTEEFLTTDFDSTSVRLSLDVPKSHWIEKVLPSLGYGEVRIVEIPLAEGIVARESPKSLDEFMHAQEYFDKGDYDKAVEHCRTAIEPIREILHRLKGMIESNTEYDWVKEIGEATCDWLDKIYKKTRNLTSKPHHLPSVGHFSRYDAEAILLVTTALIAYVGKLSKQ